MRSRHGPREPSGRLLDRLPHALRDLQSPVLGDALRGLHREPRVLRYALRDLLRDLQSGGVLGNTPLPGSDGGVPSPDDGVPDPDGSMPGEPRVPRTRTGPRPVHGPAYDGVGPHLSLPDDAMVRAVKR
jgi:hypothetical protein